MPGYVKRRKSSKKFVSRRKSMGMKMYKRPSIVYDGSIAVKIQQNFPFTCAQGAATTATVNVQWFKKALPANTPGVTVALGNAVEWTRYSTCYREYII